MYHYDSASRQLAFQGELTIYQAAQAKAALLEAAAGGCVRIDLSEVTELDTAGLQLLIAAVAAGMAPASPKGTVQQMLALVGVMSPGDSAQEVAL